MSCEARRDDVLLLAAGLLEDPEASELRAHLQASLPDYMVPGHYMKLEEFPRTTSGKTDRKALPLPELSVDEARPGKAASTPLQEQIRAIWSEVLGCDVRGVNENFFDLGGHSLMATQILARLARAFGRSVPPDALFAHPTIAALALALAPEEA